MYHVKQLRRRSGNSTYRELPAVGRAQADRRQGPDRDRVGVRAGLTAVHVGVQDGGPAGWLMTAGTVLLTLVHDDGGPQRACTGTAMMVPRKDLVDAPQESAGTLSSVVASRTRPGFTLVGQPGRLPAGRTSVLTAVGAVVVFGCPADVVGGHRRSDDDFAAGGTQQTTSLLRRPVGLGLAALVELMLMAADPDDVRVRVVGHDVLLFRHRAHFTCAADLSLVRLVVGGTVVLRQDGFAAVAVLLVAVDVDAVVAALGIHGRMTT